MRKLAALVLLLLATPLVAAPVRLPQPSPASTLTHEVGISKVTISYHRPGVKGRKIWGDLVPTGQVWRLGANNATTIELSHDALVNGNKVPAGKYALFAIPAEGEWTYIINKQNQQWGAYFHKPDQDLVRFKVKTEPVEHREWFDIDVVPVSDRALRVDVAWEKVRAPFTIEFDTPALVWKALEERLAAKDVQWDDYHTAARWAWQRNERMDEGMKWIDEAMKHESFWNYELKALMLRKLGRTDEARPLMQKAKELAKGKAPDAYIEGLDREMATWK